MEKLAILDCGGQYTKVIDRKVRELGVYSDIFPMGVAADKLRGYDAMILSGGPSSVWESGAPAYDPAIFALGIPTLGICYGMQLINEHFGGVVLPEVKTEYGPTEIDIIAPCPLTDGMDKKQTVLMSHGDAVKKHADGFVTFAVTGDVVAGIYNAEKKIIGVQFHPEVDLSEHGVEMLENFLRKVCGLKETYALEDRIETSVRMIREKVGGEKVIVLVSGGVDSAVTAALLVRALPPENVYAIHIDHGMMRKNESDLICENLKKLGLVHMKRVNAENEFFNGAVDDGTGKVIGPLSATVDPEKKRKIIGSMFVKVTAKAAEELGIDFDNAFLAQGTLRPDLIESGNPDVSGYANKIKTHHNDVDIIRKFREKGKIIETNWDWHKDEVRQVARMLGLDEEIASRQPFPGPGLGVRILCNDSTVAFTTEQREKLADFLAAYDGGKYAGKIAPIRSVGVQGDNRSYKSLVVLGGGLPVEWDALFEVARAIPNNLPFINRVAYRVDSKEPVSTLTCTPMHICHETAEVLREADAIVTSAVMNKKIAQCFAVLLPISTDETSARPYSVVIRAVVTSDYMTARAAVPGVHFPVEALESAAKQIKEKLGDKVDMVLYDITGKPPATIEWE